MKALVFDIETDGLLDEVTKIHCMSYREVGGPKVFTETRVSVLLDRLHGSDCLIGHSISTYDLPVLKKLYGFEYKGMVIDTLFLSWYLDPKRPKHGLESYGIEYGLLKTEVAKEQWAEGNIELMIERCERDVEINYRLWGNQKRLLERMYPA